MIRPIHLLASIMTLAVSLSACATAPRFRDQPIVWRVNDRGDVPQPPAEREFLGPAYYADLFVARALTRVMELRDHDPARDTNALDELPDSTWFTNRIGIRRVSPAEAATGPAVDGPPEAPLTVVHGKTGGGNPGFIVEDARGERYLVKFDTKDNPEMQTATNVIVNRILWNIGYNVPQDYIFVFSRGQLVVGDGATYKDELENSHPISGAWVDSVLDESPRLPDGRFRATASLFLEGVPVGGWSNEGTRSDDPNDTIDHQDRRVLRALRVFAAWTSHTDMKADNTLDMWVGQGERHYLKHYLVDFGEALGSHQAEKRRLEDGWEYIWDWQAQSAGLLSLGLWRRPWEGQEETPWPAIGAFSGERFDPLLWREAYPYWPFQEADEADLYWGAKLVTRFDRPTIEAIVAAGQLSNADAARYLIDALMQRRMKIARAWLEAVTPLDYFRMRGGRLCMVDVAMRGGVANEGIVERLPADFRPEFDDGLLTPARRAMGVEEFRLDHDGSVCLPIPDHARYTVDRLRVRRGHELRPIMQVHYIGGERPRVLGVVRVE